MNDPRTEPGGDARAGVWQSAAAAALVVLAYGWQVGLFWGQVNDDAYITFRYSQFLSLGRGPYYNVGEHVEGYTNFLLMLLLAVVHRVGGDAALPIAAKWIGAASGAAAILVTWRWSAAWFRALDPARPPGARAWIAPALVAASSAFAVNSTTGLETTLFAALLTTGLWLTDAAADARRWRGGGLAFALAALTRPEGAMVFASTFLGQLIAGEWRDRPGRRRLLLDAAIVGATVAGHVTLRMTLYDGEVVPNTYTAKAGGFFGTTPLQYVLGFALGHGAIGLWLLGVVGLLAAPPALRRRALPAGLLMAASWAAIFAAGADWMRGYRLLAPYLPVYAALAALGVGSIGLLVRSGARTVALAGLALAAGSFLWETRARTTYSAYASARARGYAEGHAALADWLRERTRPGDLVALMDIGIVGYRCPDLGILDISGLTDRTIASSPGGFLDKQYDPAYVFDRQPAYVVLTLTAPFVPGSPISLRDIDTWTTEEHRLYVAPQFRGRYVHIRTPMPGADELERIAAYVGAERVFPHEYPGEWYLLAAFRR